MLTIRFARVGKKNRPQFKIMLQEHTVAPGGTHVEILGSYDPHSKKAVLKEERIRYWAGQGVKISDTAYNLFLKQGVLTGEKRKVKIPAKKVEEAAAQVPAEAKPEEVKVETAEAPKTEEVKAEKKKEEKSKKETPKLEEKKEEVKPEEVKARETPKAEAVEVKPVEEVPKAE